VCEQRRSSCPSAANGWVAGCLTAVRNAVVVPFVMRTLLLHVTTLWLNHPCPPPPFLHVSILLVCCRSSARSWGTCGSTCAARGVSDWSTSLGTVYQNGLALR
jgi:hypothetical protein